MRQLSEDICTNKDTSANSGTGKNYGYYTEMPGHGIDETLSAFVPIYTIYLYKAGGENAVNSSL